MRVPLSSLEPLEPRIAPAGFVYQYMDVDGDLVSVAVSKGTLDKLELEFDEHGRLARLGVADPVFSGADISITSDPVAGGDGKVDIGLIAGGFGAGERLGRVYVDGSVNALFVGLSATVDNEVIYQPLPALISFEADSIGGNGFESGLANRVGIGGSVENVVIHGDINRALLRIAGDTGKIKIGGNLVGGDEHFSGTVQTGGTVGKMKVAGSLLGGEGNVSGAIIFGGDATLLAVGGSIKGGAGAESGFIGALGANIARLKIGGSIIGGSGYWSGYIGVHGFGEPPEPAFRPTVMNVGHLIVEGSIISGGILPRGTVHKLTVLGNLGGELYSNGHISVIRVAGDFTASLTTLTLGQLSIAGSYLGGENAHQAEIFVARDFGKMVVGKDWHDGASDTSILGFMKTLRIRGNVFVGMDATGATNIFGAGGVGTIEIGGSIFQGPVREQLFSLGSLGSLQIGGDVIGMPEAPVSIGIAGPAVGAIKIGGSVSHAEFILGRSFDNQPGRVIKVDTFKVNGDWNASTLVIGGRNGPDRVFGTADDALGPASSKDARLQKLIIKGEVRGTETPDDEYGIFAGKLGSVSINGRALVPKIEPLSLAPTDDLFLRLLTR